MGSWRLGGAHIVGGDAGPAIDGGLDDRRFGLPAKLGDLIHGAEGRNLGRFGGCSLDSPGQESEEVGYRCCFCRRRRRFVRQMDSFRCGGCLEKKYRYV